jgi:hypothetical protein
MQHCEKCIGLQIVTLKCFPKLKRLQREELQALYALAENWEEECFQPLDAGNWEEECLPRILI